MQKFFFDTADDKAILNIWSQIKSDGLEKRIAGITTNPKALNKFFKRDFNLEELKNQLLLLDSLLDGFGADDTIIYVQIPSDSQVTENVERMANFAEECRVAGVNIGIKIPHYTFFLDMAELHPQTNFNVTGVADFNVAAKALSYEFIRYVSIIPGRMEEVGMDYKQGLSILNDNKNFYNSMGESRVIAGSMRTLEQLQETVRYCCVPTIGETAFKNIIESIGDKISFEDALVGTKRGRIVYGHDYSGNQRGADLSAAFFKEMNEANLMRYE